jgi:hypothetical protein
MPSLASAQIAALADLIRRPLDPRHEPLSHPLTNLNSLPLSLKILSFLVRDVLILPQDFLTIALRIFFNVKTHHFYPSRLFIYNALKKIPFGYAMSNNLNKAILKSLA